MMTALLTSLFSSSHGPRIRPWPAALLWLWACLLCCGPVPVTGLELDVREVRPPAVPVPVQVPDPSSSLPVPLDSNLSNNFTTSCARFIGQFLSDPRFKQCYPISMLLRGSLSFFNAAKSSVSLTPVIDASCTANPGVCTAYLAGLAADLVSDTSCGADFGRGNAVVVEAYQAMLAYAPLYRAACLKDPATSQYCYADAATNRTNPTDAYFYFLPLNVSLPAATLPTCSWCLQTIMHVYQDASANRQAAISTTYPGAAQQVNTICGPGFVNQTLPDMLSTSAAASVPRLGSTSTSGPGPAAGLAVAVFLASLAWI